MVAERGAMVRSLWRSLCRVSHMATCLWRPATAIRTRVKIRASQDCLIATPNSGDDSNAGIQDIWFVPLQDRNGNDLTPIYAAIEEL